MGLWLACMGLWGLNWGPMYLRCSSAGCHSEPRELASWEAAHGLRAQEAGPDLGDALPLAADHGHPPAAASRSFPGLQVIECTNLDYSARQKKLGRPPPLRLWPTSAHLHTVSWWAAVLQVAGILVSSAWSGLRSSCSP